MHNFEVKRTELKYYINYREYHALVNRLKYTLKADVHSIPHKGYFIRSLYFDSYDDECLFEKQSGVIFRKKYRLRIYDFNTQKVKFEIKNKLNNQIYKETTSIPREIVPELVSGNYNVLLKYNNPMLNKIYSTFIKKLYKPKVIVDYYRDAYIFDFFNLRITIDKDLRTSNSNLSIFSNKSHPFPVILENKIILEIKYDHYLPDFIKNILQLDSFERMAISKYALSRKFFKINKWEDQ